MLSHCNNHKIFFVQLPQFGIIERMFETIAGGGNWKTNENYNCMRTRGNEEVLRQRLLWACLRRGRRVALVLCLLSIALSRPQQSQTLIQRQTDTLTLKADAEKRCCASLPSRLLLFFTLPLGVWKIIKHKRHLTLRGGPNVNCADRGKAICSPEWFPRMGDCAHFQVLCQN